MAMTMTMWGRTTTNSSTFNVTYINISLTYSAAQQGESIGADPDTAVAINYLSGKELAAVEPRTKPQFTLGRSEAA